MLGLCAWQSRKPAIHAAFRARRKNSLLFSLLWRFQREWSHAILNTIDRPSRSFSFLAHLRATITYRPFRRAKRSTRREALDTMVVVTRLPRKRLRITSGISRLTMFTFSPPRLLGATTRYASGPRKTA